VSTIDNNDDTGGTNLRGLGFLGSFFDWISMLCKENQFDPIIAQICYFLPKFGLIWHEPGDAANEPAQAAICGVVNATRTRWIQRKHFSGSVCGCPRRLHGIRILQGRLGRPRHLQRPSHGVEAAYASL